MKKSMLKTDEQKYRDDFFEKDSIAEDFAPDFDEDVSFIADDPQPLIPDGDYYAECIRTKRIEYKFSGKTVRKLKLIFRITEGEHRGMELPHYINCPEPKKKVTPVSKYYQSWVVANYGKLPKGGIRQMPFKVFKGNGYTVHVKRVTPQSPGGRDLPECLSHSVIDCLVAREEDIGI